jgi:ATPase subunit of ABC transporter with duplicated ATPase domains
VRSTAKKEPSAGPKRWEFLRQDQFAFDAFRVIDTVIMGNPALWEALQERETLYAKDYSELTDKDGMRLGELEGIVGDEGGYTAETDAAILLDGLDIPESMQERKMGELQGGQKVRVLLAQALFGNPEVLLLGRTDQQPRPRFRPLASGLPAGLRRMFDSHFPRSAFLNEICTHVADIDYQSVITYTGGYDDMVLAKTQIRQRIEAGNAQREKKIEQLNEFIARFAAGTRSTQVASRKKEVERLQTAELAKSNIARPYIRFDVVKPSGRHPLEVERLSKSYGPLKVFHDFTAKVSRGEKIALIGRNGAGKTTFLKSLIRNAQASSKRRIRNSPSIPAR